MQNYRRLHEMRLAILQTDKLLRIAKRKTIASHLQDVRLCD